MVRWHSPWLDADASADSMEGLFDFRTIDEHAWLASSVEVPGLAWPKATQWVQMLVLDHQRFTMLVQKEADARGRECRPQLHGVRGDGIEVEEFDHLKRAPNFFPATRVRR